MKQMRFEWAEESPVDEPTDVALVPETTAAVITLMMRAVIAVVRAAPEAADDR